MMRVKSLPISGVKAGPDDGLDDGEFLVYPSTFTRTPDSYGDVVAKGAFADTISAWKESGNTMPGLYGHRMDDPDFFVAGATDMGEDEHGWWVKGQFDLESPKGNQVYRLVKGRRLSQLSFAYDVLDEGKTTLDDGTTANELRALTAHEFSFVPVGANQDTSVVAVKTISETLTHEIKEGRVLASRHVDRLREAHSALGEVIDAARPVDEGKARKSAISASSGPSSTSESDWDGPANEANLPNDAGESVYREAYAWVNSDADPDAKSSYKFIHHEVSDDGTVGAANINACTTGIAVLNGGRGGADIPDSDRQGVYDHLAKHLTDADVEPPELKSPVTDGKSAWTAVGYTSDGVDWVKTPASTDAERKDSEAKAGEPGIGNSPMRTRTVELSALKEIELAS